MIDGLIFYGRNPSTGRELNDEQFLSWLKVSGLKQAIVGSYTSLFYNDREGNKEVLSLFQKYPEQVIPAVILSPNNFDVFSDFEYLDDLIAQGARVLGVYPGKRRCVIQLESDLVYEIVHYASSKGLVIQFGLSSMRELQLVLNRYSNCASPILVRWVGRGVYDYVAEMILACKKFPSVYFDIGSVTNTGAIKLLIRRIGADRFYFASAIPEEFNFSGHMMLQTAGLGDADLANIYHQTLEKVLSLPPVKGKLTDVFEGCDKNWKAILAQPKIDTHWHLNGWNIIEPTLKPQDMHIVFDKFNYSKVVISAISALRGKVKNGNAQLGNLIEKDKTGRLYGYIVLDPMQTEISLREIEYWSAHPRFVGVKTIQDVFNIDLGDERYYPLFELASKKGLPLLAHIPGISQAARKFPDLTFIAAHSTWDRVKHLADLPNVVFDLPTSHNDVHETNLEKLISVVGDERILFGSDGQLINPAWTLGKIASCDISQKSLCNILYNNALKVFPKLSCKM